MLHVAFNRGKRDSPHANLIGYANFQERTGLKMRMTVRTLNRVQCMNLHKEDHLNEPATLVRCFEF